MDVKTINFGFVNAFLIKARKGWVLIDTGTSGKWEKLEKELLSIGCLPNKLNLVILTHGDLDHSGNCRKLQDKYHVKIAIHKADSDLVEKGIFEKREVKSLIRKILFPIMGILIRFIIKKEDLFKADIFLTDGDSLVKYGLNAKVIYIPGHTKGSIGILTKDKEFFAGDTFVNRRKPESAEIIQDSEDLNRSLEKLRKLDIKTVYPAHGKAFEMKDLSRE